MKPLFYYVWSRSIFLLLIISAYGRGRFVSLVISSEEANGLKQNISFDLVGRDVLFQASTACTLLFSTSKKLHACVNELMTYFKGTVLPRANGDWSHTNYYEYYAVFLARWQLGASELAWLRYAAPDVQASVGEVQRVMAADRAAADQQSETEVVERATELFNLGHHDRAEALAYHALLALPGRSRLISTLRQSALVLTEATRRAGASAEQSTAFALLFMLSNERDLDEFDISLEPEPEPEPESVCSPRASDAVHRLRVLLSAIPSIPVDRTLALEQRRILLLELRDFVLDLSASGSPRLSLSCLEHDVSATPFSAAHQGLNDLSLQFALRDAFVAVCPNLEYITPKLALLSRTQRKRIGFVSSHFFSHSVGRILLQVIHYLVLDHSNSLEVVVFSVGRNASQSPTHEDEETRAYQQILGINWVVLPHDLVTVRLELEKVHLDGLIFADLGMDFLTYALSLSRLAQVQCAFWGHPVTSGSRHIDFFLSIDSESSNAASAYSEQLVRMDLINSALIAERAFPSHFQRPWSDLSQLIGGHDHAHDRGADIEGRNVRVVMVLGRLFKLSPPFISVVAEFLVSSWFGKVVVYVALIAESLNAWNNQIITSLEFAVRGAWERRQGQSSSSDPLPDGLLQRLRIVSYDRSYYKLLQHPATRAVMDTFPYGGCLTTHDALAEGVPVVTWPHDHVSGRYTAAMYQQMEAGGELIASSSSQFNFIVQRLVNDEAFYVAQSEAVRIGFDNRLHQNRKVANEWAAFFSRVFISLKT